MWSAIRWHAYRIIGFMPYVDLQKAGITSPKDLIQFPWDNDNTPKACTATEDDIEEMQQILIDMNRERE